MKLTNLEIFNTREPMRRLMQERFPSTFSFKLVKLVNSLDEPFKAVNEVRDKLIKEYGRPVKDNPTAFSVEAIIEKVDKEGKPILDEDGKALMEANPNFPPFAEELNKLFVEEVDVDVTPVKLPEKVASTCDKCHHNMSKELEIEAAVLLALQKFLEME